MKFSDTDKAAINVMVDLETLGTSPGCPILSIGAVTFLTEVPCKPFYTTIDISNQNKYGLLPNPTTVSWWGSQDKRVREEAFSGKDDLFQVLTWFSSWLGSLQATPVMWGNAASFDLSILSAAYKAVNLPLPWKYWNEMCFRTLKNLYHGVVTEPERTGHKHNALNDAIHQAEWATKIYKFQSILMKPTLKSEEEYDDS